MRVLYNMLVDSREAVGRSDVPLDENAFVNNKLTAKLTRQLEETMIIARQVAIIFTRNLLICEQSLSSRVGY